MKEILIHLTYLLIKDEKCFDKYNKILAKVNNIIKNKFNSEIIYKKQISKSWEKSAQKKVFNTRVI